MTEENLEQIDETSGNTRSNASIAVPIKPAENNRKSVLLIIALFVLLGLGVAGVWIGANRDSTSYQTIDQTSEQVTAEEDQLKRLLDELESHVQIYSTNFSTSRDTVGVSAPTNRTQPSLTIQAEGTSLQVKMKSEFDSPNPDEATAEKLTTVVYDDIKQYLIDKQYRVSRKEEVIFDKTSVLMKESNTYCELSHAVGEIYIGCTTHSKLQELADKLKPFITAFKTNNPKVDLTTMRFGGPHVEDSSVEGYKRASVGIGVGMGGASGLFYQANNTWHYFTSIQDILDCKEYEKSDDVANAFAGELCYDPSEADQGRPVRAAR